MTTRREMVEVIARDRVANLTTDAMNDYILIMNENLKPIDQNDWLNDETGLKQRIYQLEVEECQTYDDALLSEEHRLTIQDQDQQQVNIMNKYTITIGQSVFQYYTVELEASSAEEAERLATQFEIARQMAPNDDGLGIEWDTTALDDMSITNIYLEE